MPPAPVSMSPSVASRMCLLNSGPFFVLRFLDSALNLCVLFLRATLECQGCPPKVLSGWGQLPQRAHPSEHGWLLRRFSSPPWQSQSCRAEVLEVTLGLLHPPSLPAHSKSPGEGLFICLFIFKELEVVRWVLK